LKSGGFDIFPEETDRQEVAAQFLKIISEPRQSVTFTHRYKNQHGETRWMETIFTNHLNVTGINAVIANFRDVTERVEAETRKNDFMGIAAHEIKNPITVVNLNAELQQSALENNNYQLAKKCNVVIQENTKKVSRLLEEFMNFSGFESALLDLQFISFDVCAVINSSIVTFSAGYKNEVVVQGDTTTVIKADRSRIEQVIVNLLSNAAKYSAAGSPVTVNCAVTSSNITISVIDKGMGIHERELGLLFNKFHRVRSTHNKTKGYGLGLYICAEIIKAHKGKIGVESKEGEGSVFWFSLPLSSELYS
jgi:signal transduction histidine kinase